MEKSKILTRRNFLEAIAALSSLGVAACAARPKQLDQASAADHKAGKLPARGEFVVRNAYLVTMDPKLGDIPSGDVHLRNGSLIAVGPNLSAPGAEEIDGRNRIAMPGFVDTHFHLWGKFRSWHRRRRRLRLFPGDEPAWTGDDAR